MAVNKRPRLLIEEWLPAAAIGVECMRERGSASALAPHTFLHVWWARRPLVASRAAILGSLLPADFPRDVFERLLGFGHSSQELVRIRQLMDTGYRVAGGFNCDRAFKANLLPRDFDAAHAAACKLWGGDITVIDPMAGGGSIPLEAVRLGFKTLANEYNPVACSILEATVDYPFRYGKPLATKARKWAKVWMERIESRLSPFYPEHRFANVHAYVLARTVPCPDTDFETPLVPDWHLLKPKSHSGCTEECRFAVPVVNRNTGTWTIHVQQGGRGARRFREAPPRTYSRGKGVSLFSGETVNGVWRGRPIESDYIKAMAQQGKMRSTLYAIVLKTPQGFEFRPPDQADLDALAQAKKEVERLRPGWEKAGITPIELYPQITSDERPRLYGMEPWANMFSPRQLLCMGVLVEELKLLRPEILKDEGKDIGEAVVHLLAFAVDKFGNHNCYSNRWENTRAVIKGKMDRHDYAFKPAFAELAPCTAGVGLNWAVENVLESFADISDLPRDEKAQAAEISMGSATSLPQLADKGTTAIVVDPPYADNVQYSELADFFYVWLKRTQGHRRPEWFSTYLCEHNQEAVVNASRFKHKHAKVKDAKAEAHEFYQKLMTDTFRECHRVLRDDGVLTVMFTHKKQDAWKALFEALVQATFVIEATWPVKTESEHSLHQAKKNAAQSTVILVSRKRPDGAGVGYFDIRMRKKIRQVARDTAERLKGEGLNPIDQLVGSFGPAMEVYSRYDEVRTDVGDKVGVDKAMDEASEAVSSWRIEQLAARGLEGVEAEGQFYLLCWDVLLAGQFRFNDAHLLGKAVGMDVDTLISAGLISKKDRAGKTLGEYVRILPAVERRRKEALKPNEVEELLFGTMVKQKKRTKKDIRRVHPNDPQFLTALDACHAAALRYIEAKGGTGGLGSAKALMRQQGWGPDSAIAKLMEALVRAAPEAVKFEKGKKSAAAMFPEFRAWHELLKPLFGIEPPEWKEKQISEGMLAFPEEEAEDDQDEGLEDEEADEGENDGLSEE